MRRPTIVRRRPARTARGLGHLKLRTREGTDELVALTGSARSGWVHVRTPLLPTGTTGWVRSDALSAPRRATTTLEIDRRHRRVVLWKAGHEVLHARAGIGKPSTPTPAGRFYVRTRLVGLDPRGPYGPLAIGTSAHVDGVTGWPGGGGYVGVHGTDEPELLGHAPSHGCVRVSDRTIRRLGRLLEIGSPVVVR